MSAGSSRFSDRPTRVVLRWFDHPGLPYLEESVEVLETRFAETVVCASREIPTETAVLLDGLHYKESGVVRFCRADGDRFVVTISIGVDSRFDSMNAEMDPGVIAVENFLTEEQELKILKDLEDELSRFSFARMLRFLRSLVLLPLSA